MMPNSVTQGWILLSAPHIYEHLYNRIQCLLRSVIFRIPMSMYVLLAFLTVGTMGLSNTSVGYLNYPTQVIFKCCKLIPVMIGGVLIQGNTFMFSYELHNEKICFWICETKGSDQLCGNRSAVQ